MDWIDEMFGGGDSAAPTNELQRTEEWFKQRANKLTGSTFPAIMTTDKNGHLSTTALNVIYDKLEEMRGNRKELTGPWLDWGNEHEPAAFRTVSELTDIEFNEVGFYEFTDQVDGYGNLNGRVGSSPDGLAEEWALELKCPWSEKVFRGYQKDPQKLVKKYYWQVVGHMIATDTNKAILAAYDPRSESTVIERIERDEKHVKMLLDKLSDMINLLDFLNKKI